MYRADCSFYSPPSANLTPFWQFLLLNTSFVCVNRRMKAQTSRQTDRQRGRERERNNDFDDTRNNVAKIAWQPWNNNNGHKMALKLPTHLPTWQPSHLPWLPFFHVCALWQWKVCVPFGRVCVYVGVSVCMSVYRACVLCEILPYIAKHFHAFWQHIFRSILQSKW